MAYELYEVAAGQEGAAYLAVAVVGLAVLAVAFRLATKALDEAAFEEGLPKGVATAALKLIIVYLAALVFVSLPLWVAASVVGGDAGDALAASALFTATSTVPVGLVYIVVAALARAIHPNPGVSRLGDALAGLAMYTALAALVAARTGNVIVAAALGLALAAVIAYSRLGRARWALRQRARRSRVGWLWESLFSLMVAFKRARQKLVLEEGRLSDRALYLYYLLEQARMVDRFIVDPGDKLEGFDLEDAMADPPREAASRVDEGLLGQIAEALELTDPQGLRIYRAPDGRFHVAAGDVIEVPIARPDAAPSALYDVITHLRAEIERETGRPYRPLVLTKFLPGMRYTSNYAVDPVGLLEEIAEHPDEYRDLVGDDIVRKAIAAVRAREEEAGGEAPRQPAAGESHEEEPRRPRKKRGGGTPPPGHGVN